MRNTDKALWESHFRSEELRGEKLTNRIRLVLVGIAPVLLLITVANNHWVFSPGNIIVLTGIASSGVYSLGILYFLTEKRYKRSIVYFSAIVEALLVTLIVFSGAFDLFASAGSIFIVNTFHVYFVLTGLSLFRFSFVASAFSGICNAIGYSVLIYWASLHGAFDNIFRAENSNAVVRFSVDNEIFKVLFLLLMGIVAAYATKRNRRLLTLYIEKQHELDTINSGLEETILTRTGELSTKQKILEKDLDAARDLQRLLLPKELPIWKDYRISAEYIPMESVAGDFYDVIPLEDGQWGIFVCDVSGHGVPAAFIASMVKMSLDQVARRFSKPSLLLSNLNERLTGKIGKNFVTAFYAVFNPATGELVFANAGHTQPIHVFSDSGDQRLLSSAGMMLGFKADPAFADVTTRLGKGERIVIYTDGVVECRNPAGELFGDGRFAAALGARSMRSGEEAVRNVLRAMQEFTGKSDFDDDITLVVLEGL